MQEIPFFDFASFTEDLTLDGEQYRFRFHYNERGDFWVVDFLDTDGNVAVAGVKVVGEYELIRQYHYANIPKGAMSAVNTVDPSDRVGRQSFNENTSLIYVTAAEYGSI